MSEESDKRRAEELDRRIRDALSVVREHQTDEEQAAYRAQDVLMDRVEQETGCPPEEAAMRAGELWWRTNFEERVGLLITAGYPADRAYQLAKAIEAWENEE